MTSRPPTASMAWTTTTSSTRPAPTCCAASAGLAEAATAYEAAIALAGNAAERDFLRGRQAQVRGS